MFRSLPRSGTYRSKTYCMEKAFEFLKANKAVAFKNLHSIIRMLLDERRNTQIGKFPIRCRNSR